VSAYRKFIDTLQSEPWTPTPPKPPKAPKADPGEPVSLPVLGGLGTLDAARIKVENAAVSTVVGEHAANLEYGSAGAVIIAPGKWAERGALPTSSEPGFSEPWPPRRGRIDWQGEILLHFCSVCGAWGSYGFGVNLRGGRMGRWFCAAHRPQGAAL
jgi:hypothetical protein